MKKVNRSQQPPAKGDWPPKSSYVSQAISKMTDEIKELLHDTINIGIENNRMLRWMVIERIPVYKRKNMKQPDISDILEKK